MKRIGIMGGTFNPIHIGHLTLAQWALDGADLDEVWFIPTGISYMKSPQEESSSQEVLPSEERLHMTELAIRGNDSFKCLDIEVKREGYTYSYETMEQLKKAYPEDEFFFIAGADCLFAMENWRNPERIFSCATLVASVRGDATMQEMEEKRRYLEQKYQGSIMLLPFLHMSISSTEIRRRVREGRSVRYLVPDSVLAYIKEKEFYREKSK